MINDVPQSPDSRQHEAKELASVIKIPRGRGVRQSSGALTARVESPTGETVFQTFHPSGKAVEDYRSPRRWRAVLNSPFLPTVHGQAVNSCRVADRVRLVTSAATSLRPSLSGLLLIVILLAGCSREPATPRTALDSPTFSHVEIIGTRGTGVGQFTKPRSVALDRNDNLYVVDMTGRVQKFSPGGDLLTAWRMPQTDLGRPKGMGRDDKGNIIVVEPHYQRVNHFAPDGTLVEQWGERGTNIGQLTLPRSVAVTSRGDIFLCEYTTVDRVQGFSAQGRHPFVCFGQPGTSDGQFNRAEGLGIDAQDRLYVADSCNHRIQIFSTNGQWLKTYGHAGRGLGELSYPFDVKVDEAGRQFVAEFANNRIQIFDSNNRPVEILGRTGAKPGEFNNPWSIAFDSHGHLYVADAGNHRVQKFFRRHPLPR